MSARVEPPPPGGWMGGWKGVADGAAMGTVGTPAVPPRDGFRAGHLG
jgi:hypothetical protein